MRERPHHGGHVELRVVGENTYGVTLAEPFADLVEQVVGPSDLDHIGCREPGLGGEHGSGVAHRHVVPEDLGNPHQRGGEVDRAEDHHPRRRGVGLDEHRHGLFAGLAAFAVVADPGASCGELTTCIASDDAVEVVVAEAAVCLTVEGHHELGAGARTLDHGGQRHRVLGDHGAPQPLVEAGLGSGGVLCHRRYQSKGSMNRWMVPPQVRPTANASSSL